MLSMNSFVCSALFRNTPHMSTPSDFEDVALLMASCSDKIPAWSFPSVKSTITLTRALDLSKRDRALTTAPFKLVEKSLSGISGPILTVPMWSIICFRLLLLNIKNPFSVFSTVPPSTPALPFASNISINSFLPSKPLTDTCTRTLSERSPILERKVWMAVRMPEVWLATLGDMSSTRTIFADAACMPEQTTKVKWQIS